MTPGRFSDCRFPIVACRSPQKRSPKNRPSFHLSLSLLLAVSLAIPAGSEPASPKASAPAKETEPASRTGALRLTVEQAILVALANNRDLRVERANPAILRTFEDSELALFEPVVGGEIARERRRYLTHGAFEAGTRGLRSDETAATAFVEEFLPTGTTLRGEGSVHHIRATGFSDSFTETRLGLTVTQALLRGATLGVNLVGLRQARLDTKTSEYELRAFIEALVAQVESAYWDYVLAQKRIAIVENSMAVAQQQLEETQERIRVGRLSEAELAAAQAEVARRKEELIDARSRRETVRLRLLRLLNPPRPSAQQTPTTDASGDFWEMPIEALDEPDGSAEVLDSPAAHAAVALRLRPEMNQARLQVRRNELDLVRARNGLLPRMDAFLTLGKTGYSEQFRQSLNGLDGIHYDVSAGVTLEVPVANRDAIARNRRAHFSRSQAVDALRNLEQLIELDVRTAYVEVLRTRAQVSATAESRRLQQGALDAETEKFKVGKSTAFIVAQAQRDLLASKLAEVEAVVNHLKALIELYRLEGALLERRGVAAPGREPVETTD